MINAEHRFLTDAQLAARFEAASVESAKREGDLNPEVGNRLARERIAIRKELERRGPRSLGLLLPLLDHPNRWIRFYAAVACLSVDRQRCLAMLRAFHEAMDGALAVAAFAVRLECDPDYRAEVEAETGVKYIPCSPDEGH